MERTNDNNGYWLVADDGGIFTFGHARFRGSMGGKHLNQPVLGMERTKSGNGYWLFASDGGIFTFGDAHFYGSLGGRPPPSPIVAMQRTASGKGYWMMTHDGRVYSFGDAALPRRHRGLRELRRRGAHVGDAGRARLLDRNRQRLGDPVR